MQADSSQFFEANSVTVTQTLRGAREISTSFEDQGELSSIFVCTAHAAASRVALSLGSVLGALTLELEDTTELAAQLQGTFPMET